jgi:hypothetical protein
MGTLAAADTMMSIAETEATAAGLLPPSLMIKFQFSLSKGNPVNIDRAGQAWREAAEHIQQMVVELRQAVAKVPPDDWTADDRTAYEQKVQEFCSQLQVMYVYCLAVGIALTVYAYALFIYAVFAVGMGTFLAGLAVFAAAALASIVGAEAYAACLEIAATCLTITEGATAILAGAATGAGMVFQGGAITSAVVETFRGNDAALGDLKQAEVTGSAAALAGLGQNAINAGLAYAGGGGGKPLQSVDLDADRDKDNTWIVGGGVSLKTKGDTDIELGGHAGYGDRGWMGGDGEATYADATVKGGETEDIDGKHTVSAGIEYSHENKTGHGGTIGLEGEHGIEDEGGDPRR